MKNTKLSEIKVSYHPPRTKQNPITVYNSDQAYKILHENRDMHSLCYQEESKALYLNYKFELLWILNHTKWTEDHAIISGRQLIAVWLKVNAAWFILAHNHPSWTLWASEADYKATKQLEKAAGICQLKLYDHIIIRKEEGYYSFAKEWILGYGYDYNVYAPCFE